MADLTFMRREIERRQAERDKEYATRRVISVARVAALNGSIDVPGKPGFVWVSTLGLAGSRYQAFNKGFTLIDQTPVMVAVSPQRPFTWEIIDIYTGDMVPQSGATAQSFKLPNHAQNHQWATEANPGKDPLTIYQPAQAQLKAFVQSGLVVGMRGLVYEHLGRSVVFDGAANINLAVYQPVVAGTHCYALVYLDKVSNTGTAVAGAAVVTASTPIKPLTPANAIPSAYFLIANGQSSVSLLSDYTDARPFITPEFFINTLTEQTTPTANADYIAIYDAGVGGHRRVLLQNLPGVSGTVQVLFSQLADKTVANTVTETTLTTNGRGSLTLPADLLQLGSVIRLSAAGYVSTTGTPTMNFRVKLGAATLVSSGAVTLGSGISNVGWRLTCNITCRVAGGTGSVVVSGWVRLGDQNIGLVNTSTIAVDTLIALLIDFTGQWGTASASNTITCQELVVEHLAGSGLSFDALLIESGDYLLLETGDHLLLED